VPFSATVKHDSAEQESMKLMWDAYNRYNEQDLNNYDQINSIHCRSRMCAN